MLRSTPRQLLTVLTAVLVICSLGATPVAAMATDETGLSSDGIDTSFDSPDDSDGDDGDADDGESNDTDDSDGDDEEGDDEETSADDGSTDDPETESADDEETSDDSTADGDTDDDQTGDDAGTDRRSKPRSSVTESDAHVVGETGDRSDYEEEDALSLLRANGDDGDGDVFGPVDGLEAGTEELDDLSEDATDTTDETVDVRTLTVSIGVLEVELLTYDVATYSGDATPEATESTDGVDSSQLRAAAATGDGVVDGTRADLVGVGAADGEGGEPLPPTPGGGAAVALGTLAAVAAVRSSPFVATEGAKAASSSGTSLLSSLLEKVRPFVLPLRYSRYDDSDPLEHEAREQVYAIVNEDPGSYLSEVSEEADLPLSTTRHHIKVLEREQLVSGAKLRGKRRFYPAYAEGIELAAALNDDSTATIIDAISRIGAASVSDLAEELERDPSTISHHLQRLEEDDIVTRERDGRAVVTRLSREARTALEPESTPVPGETGEALAGGAD